MVDDETNVWMRLAAVIGLAAWIAVAGPAGRVGSAHAQSTPSPEAPLVAKPPVDSASDEAVLERRVAALTPARLRLPAAERLAAAEMAVRGGAHAEAVETLRPLVDRQPGFRTDAEGAAAHLLGRAYALQGDSVRAHDAYRAGVNALTARDAVDAPLFEAYVQSVLDGGTGARTEAETDRQMRSATAAFLEIFRAAGPDAPAGVQRHVAYTLLLWPEDRRSRVTPDAGALFRGEGTLKPGADSLLQAWWRRQDPRPASPGNERVAEHLRRLDDARRRFAADTFLGFDDRGRVYVRLGEPDVRRRLTSRSVAKSVSPDTHFMPRNEFWRYKGYGRHSHFLFVKRKHGFRQGTVLDLLPPPLRNGSAGSGALTALVLRDFYGHLVPRVPEYAPLYDEMDDLVANLQMEATTKLTTATRLADANFDPETGRDRYVRVRRPFFQEARRAEREVREKREEELPASASTAAEAAQTLPVAVRTARFLSDDGGTETEIYWSVRTNGLETDAVRRMLSAGGYGEPRRHVVRMRAQRHRLNYEARNVAESQHRVRPRTEPRDRRDEPVFSMRLPGVTDLHHLSVQWDQLVIPKRGPANAPAGGGSPKAVQTQTRSVWVDSVQALPASGALALSDLVPIKPDTYTPGAPLRTPDGWTARPYPFAEIAPGAEIGLYVEAYHLARAADGRTRYTVEYVVTQTDVPQSRLARLFRRTDTETTTTATDARSRTSTAREYVELSLDDVQGADVLTLAVRVTDEVTGQTAERSLRFRIEGKSRGGEEAKRRGE